jgi:hypothetical protein
MYPFIAFAVTVLVIVLAWRGIGAARNTTDRTDEDPLRRPFTPPRPRHDRPTRTLAPDDDPEFLSEIDRKLRGEDKSG